MNNEFNEKRFKRSFRTKDACFNYLIKHKWPRGFVCRRCGHQRYYTGKSQYHRRCKKCKYDESPTANTLFHKLKFPITKAFAIVFDLLCHPQGYSSCKLSRLYSLKQSTTWLFKRKVNQGITRLHTCSFHRSDEKSGLKLKDTNLSELLLTEAAIGAGVNLEIYSRLHPFLGHYYIEYAKFHSVPFGAFPSQLDPAKQKQIHSKAIGNTWMLSLMHLEGEEHAEMKIEFISGLVRWIRNTHRHVSPKHLFFYCSEYAYRFFNIRKNSRGFPRLIQAIILHPKLEYKQLVET